MQNALFYVLLNDSFASLFPFHEHLCEEGLILTLFFILCVLSSITLHHIFYAEHVFFE